MNKKHRKWILIASTVGVIHFAISLFIWSFYFYGAYRFSKDGSQKWSVFLYAIPAIILFLLFTATLILAYKGLRFSLYVLLLSIILSITSFSYDAINRNYQMHMESMTGKNQGGTFKYFTWWWYSHY
jgi:hypothetical protein